MNNRELACQIAQALFTDGRGERARRLVMESPSGKLGAGWIESAVARVIEETLNAAQRSAPQTDACPKCGQVPNGQGGEYLCPVCGVPTLHDS